MDVSSAVVALEAGSPERGAVERCAARARAVAILFAGVEEGLANARPMMLSHGEKLLYWCCIAVPEKGEKGSLLYWCCIAIPVENRQNLIFFLENNLSTIM